MNETVVVVNDKGQYSIWPATRELPAGWYTAGFEGPTSECLAHIERVWTQVLPPPSPRPSPRPNPRTSPRQSTEPTPRAVPEPTPQGAPEPKHQAAPELRQAS
jgi:MbtH protein